MGNPKPPKPPGPKPPIDIDTSLAYLTLMFDPGFGRLKCSESEQKCLAIHETNEFTIVGDEE